MTVGLCRYTILCLDRLGLLSPASHRRRARTASPRFRGRTSPRKAKCGFGAHNFLNRQQDFSYTQTLQFAHTLNNWLYLARKLREWFPALRRLGIPSFSSAETWRRCCLTLADKAAISFETSVTTRQDMAPHPRRPQSSTVPLTELQMGCGGE